MGNESRRWNSATIPGDLFKIIICDTCSHLIKLFWASISAAISSRCLCSIDGWRRRVFSKSAYGLNPSSGKFFCCISTHSKLNYRPAVWQEHRCLERDVGSILAMLKTLKRWCRSSKLPDIVYTCCLSNLSLPISGRLTIGCGTASQTNVHSERATLYMPSLVFRCELA
jgi:hypothetical protein